MEKEKNNIIFGDLFSLLNDKNIKNHEDFNSQKLKEYSLVQLEKNPFVILKEENSKKRNNILKIVKELKALQEDKVGNFHYLMAFFTIVYFTASVVFSMKPLLILAVIHFCLIIGASFYRCMVYEKAVNSEDLKKELPEFFDINFKDTLVKMYKTDINFIDKNIKDLIEMNIEKNENNESYFKNFIKIDEEVKEFLSKNLPQLNMIISQISDNTKK